LTEPTVPRGQGVLVVREYSWSGSTRGQSTRGQRVLVVREYSWSESTRGQRVLVVREYSWSGSTHGQGVLVVREYSVLSVQDLWLLLQRKSLHTVWTVRGSNPGRGKIFFLL
jgi:hypothetical protein